MNQVLNTRSKKKTKKFLKQKERKIDIRTKETIKTSLIE